MVTEMDHEKEEELLAAARQVEAFLTIIEMRYNIHRDEIPELIDSIRWTAKHRKHLNNATWLAASTLIVLAVTGWATSVWGWVVSLAER